MEQWWRQPLAFFFSSRRRHTRSLCDWSSDVCSSDQTTHSVCGCRAVPPACETAAAIAAAAATTQPIAGTVLRRLLGTCWGVGTGCYPGATLDVELRRSEERRVGKECRLLYALSLRQS